MEAQLPEVSSVYADEGTLAHKLCELLLRREFKRIKKQDYQTQLRFIQADELYEDSMLDYCNDYVMLVLEKLTEARTADPRARIYLEQKFDLSKYVPDSWGTADVSIIALKKLYLIDLKYGKGVPVSSERNKQLMLYALGAYLEFAYVCDIDMISLTIVQPRIDNTSTWEISVSDLLKWADTELKEKAAAAYAGTGEFVAGPHCQFCKIRATCRANYEEQMKVAAYEFAEPVMLSADEIADVLGRIKSFENWISAVGEYALDQALNHGVTWPGFKVVQGISRRKYGNEEKILETLLGQGYKKDDIGSFKLLPITQMEKQITKNKFADLLGPYVIKPPGKPALVPESDKRAALNSMQAAVDDFKDEN
jgi:hypothetical protein